MIRHAEILPENEKKRHTELLTEQASESARKNRKKWLFFLRFRCILAMQITFSYSNTVKSIDCTIFIEYIAWKSVFAPRC